MLAGMPLVIRMDSSPHDTALLWCCCSLLLLLLRRYVGRSDDLGLCQGYLIAPGTQAALSVGTMPRRWLVSAPRAKTRYIAAPHLELFDHQGPVGPRTVGGARGSFFQSAGSASIASSSGSHAFDDRGLMDADTEQDDDANLGDADEGGGGHGIAHRRLARAEHAGPRGMLNVREGKRRVRDVVEASDRVLRSSRR